MKIEKSKNANWPMRVLRRSTLLLKWLSILNGKIGSITGMKVVANDSLVVDKDSLVVGKYFLGRLLYFQRLLSLVEGIQGDVVECGVASGLSLVALATLVKNGKTMRHIWGFDSFEGLPSPTQEDLSSPKSRAKRGLFSEASEEIVLHNLKISGLDDTFINNHITLIKGWLQETLPKYDGNGIVFLHVDVDLYDSCRVTLENLWPKVIAGGIAAFDEYHAPEYWPGEKKATDEYYSRQPGSATMTWDPITQQYYAIKNSQ